MRPAPQQVLARLLGAGAAFITAGAVSWATPDGNLVVTLVPALAVGAAVWGLAHWRRQREVASHDPAGNR